MPYCGEGFNVPSSHTFICLCQLSPRLVQLREEARSDTSICVDVQVEYVPDVVWLPGPMCLDVHRELSAPSLAVLLEEARYGATMF